jgi:hypothetical protein
MPDCCHDRCGIDAFYLPYTWDDGIARYMCQRGHAWKCYWGHCGSGTAPENYGVPFWKMGDPE